MWGQVPVIGVPAGTVRSQCTAGKAERGNLNRARLSPTFGRRLFVKFCVCVTGYAKDFPVQQATGIPSRSGHGSRDGDHHNSRYASWSSHREGKKKVSTTCLPSKVCLGREFVKHPPPGTMCREGHWDRLPVTIMNKEAPGSRVVSFIVAVTHHFFI